MKIQGHTPLERMAAFPPAVRERLRSLWIESIEEYVALVAAAEPALVEKALPFPSGAAGTMHRTASTILGPRFAALAAPRPGGPLGCLIDAEVLGALARATESPARRRPAPGAGPRPALPAAARLMHQLPPVKNQGERPTCTAFASTALREFLAGPGAALSEQFLYWASKELDGVQGPGSYVHTAMAAFNEYGICQAGTWPYNPRNVSGNESQSPPPDGAVDEARSFRMPEARTVEPSYVDQYRHALAGDGEAPGMPVVFATAVFASWHQSAETNRTGKITMPLPGEKPQPVGHAWCIVGFVDDADVPGGGYFIVRNSWGDAWAADCPEAPGHALMPYAYVEKYAVEAFTGPLVGPSAAHAESGGDIEKFVRRLAKPARDLEGRLLPAGTAVLAAADAPDRIMEDTPANRRRFAGMGFTWSPESQAAAYFPAQGDWPDEFRAAVSAAAAHKQRFLAAIDENMTTAKGQPFPEVNPPAFWSYLPFEPKIRDVSPPADLTDRLLSALRGRAGVPAGLKWAADFQERLAATSAMRVYTVRGLSADVHVVAAHITPLVMAKEKAPATPAPSAELVDLARSLYDKWRKSENIAAPRFTFYTLAAPVAWESAVRGVAGGDHWVVCSSPEGEGGWQVRKPPRFADRVSLADFLDRLVPETRQHRISVIKTAVDTLLDSHYGGNVHLELIKRETGYRRSAVRDAFAAMQGRGGYRIYRTSDGHLAIDKRTGEGGIRIAGPSTALKVARTCAGGVAVAAVATAVPQLLQLGVNGTPITIGGIIFGAVQVYATGVVTKRLASRLKAGEE